MILGYISLFVMTVVFVFWVSKSHFFTFGILPKKYSYIALLLKVAAAISLWLIYTYYYTIRLDADIYKYFDDAFYLWKSTQNDWTLRWKLLFGLQNDLDLKPLLANTNFWDSKSEVFFNDNRTIIRIHLALLSFSQGVYLFHVLFFAFISFIGTTALFQFFKRSTTLPHFILFICCCCVPSVLLWASAPLKESLVLFGLGLLLYGVSKVKEKANKHSTLCLILGLLTLLSLKVYILIALLPGLWFWTSSKGKTLRSIRIRFIWIHFLSLGFLLSDRIVQALAQKQSQFKALIEVTGANSAIQINSFDSFFSLLSTVPQAIYNVLFRAVVPLQLSPFSLFAAGEHLLFIAVLFLPFIYAKRVSLQEQRLALLCISFVIITSCIIGLTVPVLGGIVRYKVPLIPFYLIAILTFTNLSKIASKLK